MEIKMIKDRADHQAALARLEQLMIQNPALGTPESDELEVLSVLIENYEASAFPTDLPDPVDAIKFRMDQVGLSQKDLIPYIGSASRVSEILSGKRSLTLPMIRALHEGLGIPTDVLVKQSEGEPSRLDWKRFPLGEMIKRGWITTSPVDAKRNAAEILERFFSQAGGVPASPAFYRKTDHIRSARDLDVYALVAWQARVVGRATVLELKSAYRPGSITKDVIRDIITTSAASDGPIRAQNVLAEFGIPLVVEPHLPHTHLDGAVLRSPFAGPVIGMTLRHDRLDNFWFTLAHELAHVALHFDKLEHNFYDADLDDSRPNDSVEFEADALAGESLISEQVWESSPARFLPSPEAVKLLARQLGIHAAIVAGKIRFESQNFSVLRALVGSGEVRKLFPDVEWNLIK